MNLDKIINFINKEPNDRIKNELPNILINDIDDVIIG